MLSNNVLPAFLALAGAVAAQAPAWGQCGGQGWVGPTVCVDGWTCVKLNQWFSTCQQVTTTQGPPPASTIISSVPPPSSTVVTCDAPWDKLEGYGAKTTGGGNGSVTNVTTCAELKTAAKKGGVIQVSGTLDKCGIIDLTDDTTLIGEKYYSGFQNGGIRIKDANNVIVRNLKFVHPPKGKDSIALDGATNVWIDHNEFQNDGLRGEKDYYDGLIDITHGSDFVTVSWNSFQDHWKGSLVGHSASNKKEDEGHLHVTYHHNWWFNVNSRTPSLRFGTGHIYSSCYEHIPTSGLNIREGAKALVENNNFILVNQSIVTNVDAKVQGFVTERNNIFYESPTIITQKGHVEPPYEYTLDPASCVCDRIYWYSGTGAVGL